MEIYLLLSFVLKIIDKINNKTFISVYLTSNDKGSIYITDRKADQIIQTDLNFNFIKQFGSTGSSNQQFDKPCGLTFYENSVYVCDSINKRIQKLSEDLVYQESYPLNFKPWNIKIIKNVACISADGEPNISLYQLNPFSFKTRMCSNNCEIYSINSWFYVYNKFVKKIECYNINGDLVDKKNLEKINEDVNQIFIFSNFNGRFIIGTKKTKKIIIF